jgi:predicted membrane protein
MRFLKPKQDVSLPKLGKIILIGISCLLVFLPMLINVYIGLFFLIIILFALRLTLIPNLKFYKKIKNIIRREPFFNSSKIVTHGRFAIVGMTEEKIYLLVFHRLIKVATGREKLYANQKDVYINDRIKNFPVSTDIKTIGGVDFEYTEINLQDIKTFNPQKVQKTYYSFRDGITITTNKEESVFFPTEYAAEFNVEYSLLTNRKH